MLKVKIDSDVLTKAIEYHTDEGEGMTVLIEDGNDLADWLSHILAKLTGYDLDELTTQAGLIVAPVDGGVTVAVTATKAGEDVLDAVKHYIL